MKKLSLLILTMSIIFVSYADSITIKVPDTAKLTVGKVYKEQLWEQYQKENFTPSNSWETLTGREIEAIYRAISPKTRLS